MRRLLASIALISGVMSSHAFAIGAIITGTGTNGALGTATISTGVNTLTLTTTVDVPPGSLIAVGAAIHASGGALPTSCTDNASTPNTYAASLTALSNSTAAGGPFYSLTTTDLPNGGTITCTFGSSSALRKDMIAVAFSGAVASPLDAASVSGTGSGTAMSPGVSGTLACPSGAAGCEILVGMTSEVQAGTLTENGSFIGLGTQGFMHMSYEIVAASTPVTYTVTNGTTGAFVAFLSAFKSSVSGVSGSGRFQPLLGVTN